MPSLSPQASWLDARNICRSMCMDLISVETPEENLMVESLMKKVSKHAKLFYNSTTAVQCELPVDLWQAV